MITCEQVEGDCCQSCHDDADEGYGYLFEVDDPQDKNKTAALVCCKKYDVATDMVEPKETLVGEGVKR